MKQIFSEGKKERDMKIITRILKIKRGGKDRKMKKGKREKENRGKRESG